MARMMFSNDNIGESRSDKQLMVSFATSLQDIPEDVMERILAFSSTQTLLAFQQTCKFFFTMTNRPSFWEVRFRNLLRTKLFIPRNVVSSFTSNPRLSYKMAFMDRFRNTIEREELTGRVWYFWFKQRAGEEWTRWDTFWVTKGKSCRKVVFLDNGDVLECYKDPFQDDEDEADNIPPLQWRYSTSPDDDDDDDKTSKRKRKSTAVKELDVDSTVKDSLTLKKIRAGAAYRNDGTPVNTNTNTTTDDIYGLESTHFKPSDLRPVFFNEPNVPHNLTMKWRFISHPLDFSPRTKLGGYIRLAVGDREVPTYVVRRLSDGNWGFILESCWGIFCSFDVSSKKASPSDADNDDTYINSFRYDPQWDTISTQHQWREAMLYNNGANTLPESNAH